MQGPVLHRLVLASLVLAASWSCKKNDSEVRIRVDVKTNQGDPVDKAQVLIDGKKLGETSNAGQLKVELTLPAGSRKRLEVKKESDTYYFAPYFESFVVSEASRQEINIPAVLYFVPKPSPAATNAAAGAAAGVVAGASVAPTPAPAAAAPGAGAETTTPDAAASSSAETAIPAAANPAAGEAAPVDSKTASSGAETPSTATPTPEAAPPAQALSETPPAPLAPETAATGDAPADLAPGLPEDTEAAAEENAVAVDPEPKATEVALLPVDEGEPAAPPAKDVAYPKPTRPNEGQTVYTVHVLSGDKPIAEAQVFLGEEAEGDLKLGCRTNARGRCVIRFSEKPAATVTFVASKKGYKTGKQTARVTDKGNLRLTLEAGQTIDIYAISKTYNFTSGLKDVEVYVGGKRVGSTDRFGHYSYVYAGRADDLVSIALKPKEYLPETYETDFVASGPMTLVRYFAPKDPPPVRMAVMALKSAGKVSAEAAPKLAAAERHVRDAARQHLFSSAAFKEFQTALFERNAERAGRSSTEALRKGWQDTELKASVDAVLLPTLAFGGSKASLELSVIDSRGRVLAAAAESLDDPEDKESIARAVGQIAKKIARAFPFEGAILSKEADKVVINIGYSSGRGIRAGDTLDISGVQSEKFGRTQSHRRIASLVVREVNDTTATCAVQSLVPRATIERGDMVALRQRRALEQGGAQLRVVASTGKGSATQPVTQANVYLNDAWIGATDGTGRLYADVTGLGQVKVIKHGYATLAQQVELKAGAKVDLTLKRETALVRIESKPAGLTVKIDGKAIGTTPLSAPVAVPSGFVKLELEAPKGYKSFAAVLELDQGTLELTGVNAVALERDERAEAQKLLAANKVDEAIAKYQEIPEGHSDWLIAQHELGEIYLTRLDQPAKAAEAFGRVTAAPAVKQFADKRFIGSHIDEAIALFMTGEKLVDENKEAAIAHYKHSIETFEAVLPHLRFVKSEQYPQAVHNVDFHRALARHRLWQYSQDPAVLADTLRSWRAYLDGSARSVPADAVSKTYVENARVYFKQATASQARPGEVAR
jgi:hypothetical protein